MTTCVSIDDKLNVVVVKLNSVGLSVRFLLQSRSVSGDVVARHSYAKRINQRQAVNVNEFTRLR